MAKRITPPRNAKGRFIKKSRSHPFRRKISYRGKSGRTRTRRVRVVRNPALVNPRRRRRARAKYAYVSNPRHRRAVRHHRRGYRRNPAILSTLGLSMPTLKTVGFTVVGVVGTPFIEGFANQYLPAVITGNKIGQYATKLGSAWLLSFAVKQIAGPEAGRTVFIGGAAYIAVAAIRDFFPTLLGAAAPVSGYVGSQPLLGAYPRMGGLGLTINAGVPDRLDPGSRF